ncbi:MAG: AAA family ATPase [Pseudomonadota bacterium]
MQATEPLVDLDALGTRIAVLGPSNAGKSTLAAALSAKLGAPVVHLDQLRFEPNTDWVMRSDDEFAALHDRAAAEERWIIEGNYSALFPTRLGRATGVIIADAPTGRRLLRYLRRTLFHRDRRVGALEGGRDSLKWEMIDWILIKSRRSAEKSERIVRATGLPFVHCRTAGQLDALYRSWGLERPA